MAKVTAVVAVAASCLLLLAAAGCSKRWKCVHGKSMFNGQKSYELRFTCGARSIVVSGERKNWNAMDKDVLKTPYTSVGSIDGTESCRFEAHDPQYGEKTWNHTVMMEAIIEAVNKGCNWHLPAP